MRGRSLGLCGNTAGSGTVVYRRRHCLQHPVGDRQDGRGNKKHFKQLLRQHPHSRKRDKRDNGIHGCGNRGRGFQKLHAPHIREHGGRTGFHKGKGILQLLGADHCKTAGKP